MSETHLDSVNDDDIYNETVFDHQPTSFFPSYLNRVEAFIKLVAQQWDRASNQNDWITLELYHQLHQLAQSSGDASSSQSSRLFKNPVDEMPCPSQTEELANIKACSILPSFSTKEEEKDTRFVLESFLDFCSATEIRATTPVLEKRIPQRKPWTFTNRLFTVKQNVPPRAPPEDTNCDKFCDGLAEAEDDDCDATLLATLKRANDFMVVVIILLLAALLMSLLTILDSPDSMAMSDHQPPSRWPWNLYKNLLVVRGFMFA